ncbi:MAG: translation elongation factor Ts, partial [bacterium]
MSGITAEQVKNLREKTGAGMMDCKSALKECQGDLDRAVDLLREKGIATARKKTDRVAKEGVIESYIHLGGKIGVLVEVNCETDFVARNIEFHSLVRDIAMQVAAYSPHYVSRDQVPADVVDHEQNILKTQTLSEGKPEKAIPKIVEGRMQKFFSEICLLEQPFIKDPKKNIQDLITEHIAKFG